MERVPLSALVSSNPAPGTIFFVGMCAWSECLECGLPARQIVLQRGLAARTPNTHSKHTLQQKK